MSRWYNTAWKERAPVSVPILGGGGGSGTYDVQFTVPSDWDQFWNNIRSGDAFDVILTSADGDLLTFKRVAFTFATRTLELAVDNLNVTNNDATNLIWIYWNNSTASDAASVFTPTSTKPGLIFLATPSNRIVGYDSPTAHTSDAPAVIFGKVTTDNCWLWFNTGGYLSGRIDPYNKRKFIEGVKHCQVELFGKTGVPVTLTCNENETRFISGWTGVRVAAGTDGQNYTVSLNITTTLGQVFSLRAGLQVRDKLPE